MELEAECPNCHGKLKVFIDLSEGVPDEAGTECDCGAIPIFYVNWEPHVFLDGFKSYERRPYPRAADAATRLKEMQEAQSEMDCH
jgi:hypothetical protein